MSPGEPATPRRRQTDTTPPEERRQARQDRRRGPVYDRRQGARRASDAAGARVRELLNKYRQPFIGLGLLGAALPVVRQVEAAGAEESDAAQTAASRAASAAGTDLEERLAQRIGETRAADERAAYVNAAVAQYDISAELAGDIFDIAQEENIDPEVAIGLVRTESTFDERAVSNVGARGLTQVMPRTAKGLIPGTSAEDLFDRRTNLRLGFRYLDQLLDKYRGDIKLALTAYNRGPGTVDKVLDRGGDPDNGYAGKVLGG